MFLHKHETRSGRITTKVVIFLYARHFLLSGVQRSQSNHRWAQSLPIFVADQLREVAVSRLVHNLSHTLQATLVCRYSRLNSPKHQSGENFVWLTVRNDSVMELCRLVSALHARYYIMQFFFVLPGTVISPNPCDSR